GEAIRDFRSSLEGSEIGPERVEVVRVEEESRHPVTGFDGLWIRDPAGEVAGSVRQNASPKRPAARQMRQIRPDASFGRRAADGVTGMTFVFEERLTPACEQWVVGGII